MHERREHEKPSPARKEVGPTLAKGCAATAPRCGFAERFMGKTQFAIETGDEQRATQHARPELPVGQRCVDVFADMEDDAESRIAVLKCNCNAIMLRICERPHRDAEESFKRDA